ncbi:cupin domain-containing protein [Paraburkholderia nemoris]|uniref:JmjC domain-containing protein n=1 Tax=Paraburkholderia nemoris TaxID=2793076 RepID=UPI0038B9CB32
MVEQLLPLMEMLGREPDRADGSARHFADAASDWVGAFNINDFDRLLTISGVEHGQFSIMSADAGLKRQKMFAYVNTLTRLCSPSMALEEMLVRGRTLLVRHIQRRSPYVRAIYNSLVRSGVPVSDVVAILSPPEAQATPPHADGHPNIQIQLMGRKWWRAWGRVEEGTFKEAASIRELERNFHEISLDSPKVAVLLKPGDLLYVPYRVMHTATTKVDFSLSISFQLHPPSPAAIKSGGQTHALINILPDH